MTDINIYCDESRHTSDPSQPYMVIGALQCPRDKKRDLVKAIHALKARHAAQGEFGWKRLSPNKRSFYWALVDLFAQSDALSFRCLVANRNELDHARFSDGDEELGFYKLYYQTLVHWLKPGTTYHIYLDWQQNQEQHRFRDLGLILERRLAGRANIACLEPVTSRNLPLIELCDLLIGAVGYTWNELQGSATKLEFSRALAAALGVRSLAQGTALAAAKFNIFRFRGQPSG